MFFTGTDMFEGDGAAATFHSLIKSAGNGKVVAKVYASSNLVMGTPYVVRTAYATGGGAWFQATELAASSIGLVGIPTTAIASGCVGWVTVRGIVDDAQAPAESFTGSVGKAIYWGGATGIGCSSTTYIGAAHHVGIMITTAANASTTCTILLTGNMYARSI